MDDPKGNRWIKVLRFLTASDEAIAGYTGMVLTGLNLKKQEEGWFMVVSAKRADGERVVSYFGGHRPYECLWALAYAVSHHSIVWKPDRYAKKLRD